MKISGNLYTNGYDHYYKDKMLERIIPANKDGSLFPSWGTEGPYTPWVTKLEESLKAEKPMPKPTAFNLENATESEKEFHSTLSDIYNAHSKIIGSEKRRKAEADAQAATQTNAPANRNYTDNNTPTVDHTAIRGNMPSPTHKSATDNSRPSKKPRYSEESTTNNSHPSKVPLSSAEAPAYISIVESLRKNDAANNRTAQREIDKIRNDVNNPNSFYRYNLTTNTQKDNTTNYPSTSAPKHDPTHSSSNQEQSKQNRSTASNPIRNSDNTAILPASIDRYTTKQSSTYMTKPYIHNIPTIEIDPSLYDEDFENSGKISNLPNKNNTYTFKGYGGSIMPLADYGIRTTFYVEGNARKINNNQLVVFASAKGDPSNILNGYITVTRNGKTYSKQKLERNSAGYIYKTGGPIPLGEATVNTPENGDYEVFIDVFGDIYETGSHFPTRFNKEIIIDK